jgi:hypothetical protein
LNDLAIAPALGLRVEADGGDDGIAGVEQFVKFVPVLGERLSGAPQGEHHFSAATPATGIYIVGRFRVFDVRGSEVVNEALRIAVDQPLCVNPPDDLDVLLRHRPPSIPRHPKVPLSVQSSGLK